MALNAVNAAYHKYGAVKNGQRSFGLGGKIRVTGSIKERVFSTV